MGEGCCSGVGGGGTANVSEPSELEDKRQALPATLKSDKGAQGASAKSPNVNITQVDTGSGSISVYSSDDSTESEMSDCGTMRQCYTDAEASIVRHAERHWNIKRMESDRQMRAEELKTLLDQTRDQMREEPLIDGSLPANRYGSEACFPTFDVDRHIPVLALINPYSGAMAGSDIMSIARKSPYYRDRFFNIIDVIKDQRRGGLMDVFRIELNRAREEASARGTRMRIISGGGDGTASFTLFILFAALRADEGRATEGLHDRGNGFIWTDDEMARCFPAMAQMPLGSANDFGHTLGWGHKFPGDQGVGCASSRKRAAAAIHAWIEAVISPNSRLANFDLFGIMPEDGAKECDFKLCELSGRRGLNPKARVDGTQHLLMKEAGTPVPLFLCLYLSAGFAAYMTARFQINRRRTPIQNKIEYARQALGIIGESVPPQLDRGLSGIEFLVQDELYFPPRAKQGSNAGGAYRDVGFLNINWQGGIANGADRAPACVRLLKKREPAKFNDGMLDMYRLKFRSALKNPGTRMQTDKCEGGVTLRCSRGQGKGIFFQWDGEARFAFSPKGDPFHINVEKILNIPVVIGPKYDAKVTGDPDNGSEVMFSFAGKSAEAEAKIRQRILKGVRNELNSELNATREEMLAAGLQCEALH